MAVVPAEQTCRVAVVVTVAVAVAVVGRTARDNSSEHIPHTTSRTDLQSGSRDQSL